MNNIGTYDIPSFSDPDGDLVTISTQKYFTTSLPSFITFSGSRYTISPKLSSQAGIYMIEIVLSDGKLPVSYIFNIMIINPPPPPPPPLPPSSSPAATPSSPMTSSSNTTGSSASSPTPANNNTIADIPLADGPPADINSPDDSTQSVDSTSSTTSSFSGVSTGLVPKKIT